MHQNLYTAVKVNTVPNVDSLDKHCEEARGWLQFSAAIPAGSLKLSHLPIQESIGSLSYVFLLLYLDLH